MLAQNAQSSTVNGPGIPETAPKSHTNPREDPESKEQRRLAPRSSNQFRVGPPFCGTRVGCTVFSASKPQEAVVPKICARLDRGFDLIEGEWIGYKRNYFTLVAAFQFSGLPLGITTTDAFVYVDNTDGIRRPLCAFKILLTSVCLEDNSTAVTLVQHTAKRDRGPQSAPPLYYAVPGELPAHSTMKLVANIRNGDKIDRCNRLFYLLNEDHALAVAQKPDCILATYPPECEISLVARYERIQFLLAGCGNRKLASTNNKHYVLVVQLLGVTALGLNIVLASTQSPPLIVRGRSPSNYPISEKKEPRAELALVKTSIANLISHDFKKEKDSIVEEVGENEMAQKKRKLKPSAASVPVSVSTKPPRPVLGVNQNILNAYTAEPFDPELLESPPKARAPAASGISSHAAFHRHWDKVNVAQMPEIFHPYQEKARAPDCEYLLPLVHASPGLIIAQENLFPFVDEDHSPSYLFVSDGEPLNINHTAFQSSQEIFPAIAARGYEDTVYDLEDLGDSDLDLPYDCYLSLPVPIAFPETLRTSTPLQLQAMQPSLLRNLHPAITRCKHGFKQRERTRSMPRRKEKVYTFADLNTSVIADAEFVAFKKKLSSFRLRFTDQSPHTSSLRLSPLTMLSSDNDAFFLHGLQGQSRGPGSYKA